MEEVEAEAEAEAQEGLPPSFVLHFQAEAEARTLVPEGARCTLAPTVACGQVVLVA